MKPIYEPKGRAKEYGDLAINLHGTCPHGCYYCYAPLILHKSKEEFFAYKGYRPGIVEATKRQLEKGKITDRLIHVPFIGDAYPTGHDSSITREIIKLLKEYGNHVQILTKGDGSRDFDLLDENDWYGITITGATREQEPGALREAERLMIMYSAPCHWWVSFEPVIQENYVLTLLQNMDKRVRVKIGKLNYHPSDINWGEFGRKAEAICIERGLDYYIKEDLRKEMEASK